MSSANCNLQCTQCRNDSLPGRRAQRVEEIMCWTFRYENAGTGMTKYGSHYASESFLGKQVRFFDDGCNHVSLTTENRST